MKFWHWEKRDMKSISCRIAPNSREIGLAYMAAEIKICSMG